MPRPPLLLLAAAVLSGPAHAGPPVQLSAALDGQLCLHDCALSGAVRATAHPVADRIEGELTVDDRMTFALTVTAVDRAEAALHLAGEGATAQADCTVSEGVRLDCVGDFEAPGGHVLPFTLELAPAVVAGLPQLAEH